jgi:oligoendopeptidase F
MPKIASKKNAAEKIVPRSEVPIGDTWDLASLYPNDSAWEKDFKKYEKEYKGYSDFRGKLKDSAEAIADCLKFDTKLDMLAERLGTYAFLRTTEDQANSHYQGLVARFQNLASQASQLASFIRPELLAIPKSKMDQFLKEASLEPYRLLLHRIIRYRDHTLSQKEEELLAMQSEMAHTASHAFRQLNDADLKRQGRTRAND